MIINIFKFGLVYFLAVLFPAFAYRNAVEYTLGEGANINEGIMLLVILILAFIGVTWYGFGAIIFKHKNFIRNSMLYSVSMAFLSVLYALN